jgi:aspartate/tyrosine/aromatic aminotransferase
VQSLSGTGALRLSAGFLALNAAGAKPKVYVPNPVSRRRVHLHYISPFLIDVWYRHGATTSQFTSTQESKQPNIVIGIQRH